MERRKNILEEGGKNTVKQHRFTLCDVSADSHSVLNACKKLRIVNSQTYMGRIAARNTVKHTAQP